MGIVSKVKSWPISVAFAAGVTISGAGVYSITQDTYAPNAIVQEASDSLHAGGKVDRPVMAYDSAGIWNVGDVAHFIVEKNGTILYEMKREITVAPQEPNDAITGTFHAYFYDDRIAPLDTVAIESVIAKEK